MKLIFLSDKYVGSELAKPVYNKNGNIVLNKGGKLSNFSIKKLNGLGIYSAYVEEEGTEDIVVEDIIDVTTQLKCIMLLEEAFNSVKKNRYFDESQITNLLKEILQNLSISENTLSVSNGVRNIANSIYVHSLNVAILSAIIGINLNYNYEKIYNLTLGAFLHDIGYALSDDEQHTVKGIEVLRNSKGINVTSYIVALQHHERIDGSGYPNQQKGNDIYEFSKIVAICNEYDNLISKKGLQPFEAFEEIIGKSSTYFDENIINVFKKSIYIYPTGMEVKLSNGDVGIVCQQNKYMPMRPIVKTKNRHYNLLEELTLFIDNN
ncbi:HD-GYP domain-containing protein [Tepidibacter aestuarii]|uniref:HD-GYP domain-containing protein n=1 Tax=Tepidibacter aestuarii TaxID=2925782 RepID=UPI0020BEB94A|nr:HD domain-containing phosphohydrolase [Tepidibacter aestuarii]CAH2213047.1 Metal dependent phosphohydrolase [Tepidibacter aestuarii]